MTLMISFKILYKIIAYELVNSRAALFSTEAVKFDSVRNKKHQADAHGSN